MDVDYGYGYDYDVSIKADGSRFQATDATTSISGIDASNGSSSSRSGSGNSSGNSNNNSAAAGQRIGSISSNNSADFDDSSEIGKL